MIRKYFLSLLRILIIKMRIFKSFKDRMLEYKEELQKLRMTDGENQNEIKKLIKLAGVHSGVGCWRPTTSGPDGTFTATF